MTRDELAKALNKAAASPEDFPEDRFDGRGIIICAGGARMFTCAWICIGMLRRLGCTLPVEVWHLGSEEMGPPMRGLLAELGAETIDAHEVAKRCAVRRLGGWELKPYALLHSRFREVLLLDADNMPVEDPTGLFDDPGFRESGALFWPDLLRLSRSNAIWSIAGLAPQDRVSFESGQLLLDKSRCWRPLTLAHWMNQRSEDFYGILHGDKDTFLIAWLMLDQHHHLVPHQPKQLEATICQRGPDGRILFQHRNGAKWVLRGINPTIEGFRREADCFALLAELEARWDGHVFNPPARGDAAKALECQLARTRRFRYVRVSSDERTVDLLADHRIGGAGGDEFYWYVTGTDDCPLLVLAGNGASSNRLRLDPDGVWRGRLPYSPGTPVELVPLAPDAGSRAPAAGGGLVQAVLERALEAYELLPRDRETARDFAGFVRTLTILDPAIRDAPPLSAPGEIGDKRRQLIAAALDGWADRIHRPDGGGISAGHSWNRHSFPPVGYDPAS
jgi:hypothetical protein